MAGGAADEAVSALSEPDAVASRLEHSCSRRSRAALVGRGVYGDHVVYVWIVLENYVRVDRKGAAMHSVSHVV